MKNEQEGNLASGEHPEARLFEQAQGGCQDSLNLLLERHEPLVVVCGQAPEPGGSAVR